MTVTIPYRAVKWVGNSGGVTADVVPHGHSHAIQLEVSGLFVDGYCTHCNSIYLVCTRLMPG